MPSRMYTRVSKTCPRSEVVVASEGSPYASVIASSCAPTAISLTDGKGQTRAGTSGKGAGGGVGSASCADPAADTGGADATAMVSSGTLRLAVGCGEGFGGAGALASAEV